MFYNSKSFKPNRLASLFRKKNKRLLVGFLVTLSEFSILLLQWPKLVLARAFVVFFFFVLKNKLD